MYTDLSPHKVWMLKFLPFLRSHGDRVFFCLGIGNERPKINFEKMKNKLLEVFIFSIILKFLENSIQPFMKNSADKKGEN